MTRSVRAVAVPRSRATIEDVARLAKVSKATVSRVFSRSAVVADETRRQVVEAALAAGYRPNGVAQALRRRTSRSVVVLVPDLANPFYPEIVHGIERRARALGYSILMGNTDADPAVEAAYLDLVRDGRADGMLLLTGRLPSELEASGAERPPIVLIAEHLPGSRLPTVRIDNAAAAAGIVGHLIGLGHRRIGHVTGPLARILSVDRLAGYRRALQEAGIAFDPALVAQGDFTFPGGLEAGEALLGLEAPPTAIFAANDESAVGVLRAARLRGLAVPRQLSVAGFDDIQLAEMSDPAITTVHQPRADLGAEAIGLLIRQLEKQDIAGAEIVLPTRLVVRGSTCPPPD